MQNIHTIRAWKEATKLAIAVRRLVSRFPKAEYAKLRDQMVRSAETAADTIAEGAGSATNAEFAPYLDMSIKSSTELESQITRSFGYGLMREYEWQQFSSAVQTVRKMTWGLRKKVLGRLDADAEPTTPVRKTKNSKRTTGRNTQNGMPSTDGRAVPPVRDASPPPKPSGKRNTNHEKRDVPP